MNSTVCILKVGFSYFFLVFEEFSGTTVKDNFFFKKKGQIISPKFHKYNLMPGYS